MNIAEDDYLSEEEGFNEDALSNEEYDHLYELLPVVKKDLASYNDSIDDLSIKEAIYYNYFELEPTVEDLKSRFPKKKVKAKTNFEQPSPDDVILTAQKQAFESDMSKLSIKDKKVEDTSRDKKVPAATKPFKSIDLAKELAGNPNFTKPNKSFVIIGHVDAGKSTLVGRILYDVGAVESKTMVKLVREAEKSNKGSFALAWIMDQTQEERSRGVTIDICATNFETSDTRFTAIDAPGHKDFVPQMIGGVSQADAALLVVDSINGEFEAGFMMNGQTKEHTLLARNLGIDEMIVAVNKMDKENWSEERFQEIKGELLEYLTKPEVGYKAENITFIPLSGLTGYNVVKNDGSIKELSWYHGLTLLDVLSKIKGAPANSIQKLEQSDFNLAINDIFDVTSSEFKIKGKVTSGLIQPGQTVCLQPSDEYLQVQEVQINNEAVDVAIAGQIAILKFKTSQFKNKTVEDISIGDLVSSINSSLKAVKKCTATVNMFNITKPLLVGTPFVLFRSNASVAARINKVKKINGVKKKKMHLVSNQIADVEIEIIGDRPLPLARFEDNKALGRLVIRREGATVGAGVVTSI
ncbi:hypothetical protein SBP28_001366 [Candidozyma auris]|nr:hypothetical protein CJJ09_001394 [[Candida] auris]